VLLVGERSDLESGEADGHTVVLPTTGSFKRIVQAVSVDVRDRIREAGTTSVAHCHA
jgi:hypothetical protein